MTTATAPRTQAPDTIRAGGILVLLVGPFLAGLDFFIVNVALPTIRRDLGASPAALGLVVAGYGTAYAVLLVLGGRLGDEYGRRRLFVVGLAAFTVTSLAAGLAPTTGVLLAARIMQGASAALMVPQTLATFRAVMTGTARGRAVALYTAAGGVSSIVGQLLGGLLVSTLSWRAVFLVNVPVGLVALLSVRRAVPRSRSAVRVGADVRGTVAFAVALGALLVALAEGPASGWPWWTWIALGVSVVAGVVLVRWSVVAPCRGVSPFLPVDLIRGATSMRRGLPTLVVFFVLFGTFMFAFSIVAQDGLRLGPLAAGVAISPVMIAYVVSSARVPALLARSGRAVLVGGLVVEAAGLAVVLAVLAWGWRTLVAIDPSGVRPGQVVLLVVLGVGLALVGCGQALGVGCLFRSVLSEVPEASAGVGGGVLVSAQQTAIALGVAGLGSCFSAVAGGGGVQTGAVVIGVVLVVGTAALVPQALRLPAP